MNNNKVTSKIQLFNVIKMELKSPDSKAVHSLKNKK